AALRPRLSRAWGGGVARAPDRADRRGRARLREGGTHARRGKAAGVLAWTGAGGGAGRVAGLPGARFCRVRIAGRSGGVRGRDRARRAPGLGAAVRRRPRSVRLGLSSALRVQNLSASTRRISVSIGPRIAD